MAIVDGSVPAASPYRRVDAHTGDWCLHSVIVIEGFVGRLVGLNRGHHAILIPTGSVHTFTMSDPIGIVCLASDGVVVATKILGPRRVLVCRQARWILEVRDPERLPPVRSVVRLVPSSGHGRNSHPLCNTHRESR